MLGPHVLSPDTCGAVEGQEQMGLWSPASLPLSSERRAPSSQANGRLALEAWIQKPEEVAASAAGRGTSCPEREHGANSTSPCPHGTPPAVLRSPPPGRGYSCLPGRQHCMTLPGTRRELAGPGLRSIPEAQP